MSGLRDKLKKRRWDTVLNAAEALFKEKGYSGTNIEDIAEKAEVSVGTIYTYFGSKGGVMYEIIKPVRDDMYEKANIVLEREYDNVLEAVVDLYAAYEFVDDWVSRKALKAFDSTQPLKDEYLNKSVQYFEDMITEQTKTLLQGFVDRGMFNKDINLDDVTFITFNLLFRSFRGFVSGEYESYRINIETFRQRLRTLFTNWL